MKKIAIIGAGITGLYLAYNLKNLPNIDIHIYEQDSKPGGLLAGIDSDELNIEEHYHHMFKQDKQLIKLCHELNINIDWQFSKTATYTDEKLIDLSNPINIFKFPNLNIFQKLWAGLVLFTLSIINNHKYFESYSAYRWLTKYLRKNTYNELFKPLLVNKFGKYHEIISMAWFWSRIKDRTNSKKNGKEYLGYPEGSYNNIIKAMIHSFKDNVTIHFNSKIKSIRTDESNRLILEVKEDNDSLQEILFDKIITTTSSDVFETMTNSSVLIQNNQLVKRPTTYIGVVTIFLVLKHQFTKYYWINVNNQKIPFGVIVEQTNLINNEYYDNKHLVYLSKYTTEGSKLFTATKEELFNNWIKYLKTFNPNFQQSWIEDSFVIKSRKAQHIVDWEYVNHIPKYTTTFPNIFLVNYSQIYPQDRGVNNALKNVDKFLNQLAW